MTSDRTYVWVWLPGSTTPVVAGAVDEVDDVFAFTYGTSYLDNPASIPLALELPLRRGSQLPPPPLTIAGCLADGAPDAWGRRVLQHHVLGAGRADQDLPFLTYFVESGSDRFGGLDFQRSATEYVPRTSDASLEELLAAADLLEAGSPLPSALDAALLHGSSIGGARPKALLRDGDRRLIAKFSSTTDVFPVVQSEAAAMDLALRVGLDVAATRLTRCLDRDVLLVERFDRPGDGTRRLCNSALTLLGLDELGGRYATYWELADLIRERFTNPGATLRELFSRIVFNVLVSNTDDHARNHAAFWDGSQLKLTPAYDLCPQLRSGGEAAQAMEMSPGNRLSQLARCVEASETYLLKRTTAREIIDAQVDTIRASWPAVADAARLTGAQRAQLWGRQILNPFAFYD